MSFACSKTLFFGITAVAGALAASPGPATSGETFGRPSASSRFGVGDVPDVPDGRGCVEQCEFDLNPCDTPIEKKLDGRCTLRD